MIRVLFFIDRYYPTDHAFIEEVYSKILPDRGYDVTIAARSKASKQLTYQRWNKAALILLPSHIKYLSDLRTLKQARRLMRGGYDIIQVRNDPLFALFAPPEKFIFQLSHLKAEEFLSASKRHVVKHMKGIADLLLRKIYLPRARYIFAISRTMEKRLTSNYAIKSSAVVPLGVGDICVDTVAVDSIKHQYGLRNKTVFIYIGTMAAARKLDVVIDAFIQANRRANNNLSLIFLGDAPNKQDVIRLKEKTKRVSAKNLHFIEKVPRIDVPNYIAACDVGLATTPINAVNLCMSPTKALEYLNSGVPVLATRIPDQHEILKKSNSGIFCEFSTADIADKMIDFHMCEERKSMGERGRLYVRQIRTYPHIADTVVSCYRHMLSNGSG